jgi:predicted O-methyltransferase YrrM
MKLASIVERTCPPLYRVLRRLNKTRRYFFNGAQLGEDMQRGHYYSPLPEVAEAVCFAERAATYDATTGELPGINLNREVQRSLVNALLPLITDFKWQDRETHDRRFHLAQGNFVWSDAIFLQAMLRHYKPQRVIEVGSGFSSALMLDTNDLFLEKKTRLTFIEPYPVLLRERLRQTDLQNVTIHEKPVQDVPPEVFDVLEPGDFLFIDSSHIARTGSDVNFLLFDVLPRLKTGVMIHVHDIFWPFEYPSELLKRGHAFNEAYALRAFLQFNPAFEIILWVPFVNKLLQKEITSAQPLCALNTGASFWLRRV